MRDYVSLYTYFDALGYGEQLSEKYGGLIQTRKPWV